MKWEYMTVPIFMGLYSLAYPFNASRAFPMDDLGEVGWELVQVIEYRNEESHLGYFKRKKSDKPSKD